MRIPYEEDSESKVFFVPSDSEARKKGELIVVTLPVGVELVSDLKYSHGAGSDKEGRVRIVVKLNEKN